MTANVHVIRQQFLHVEVNGTEADALALQNRLSGVCQDWLLPALERAFDRCVPTYENWSIERLDIDAGILDSERLEQDLAERVGQAIEKSLLTQIPSGTTPSPTTRSGDSGQKTTLHNRDDVLVYFLKTGRLPWAFRLPDGKNLEQTVLTVWQENTPSPLNTGAVFAALAFTDARKRLISQFSSFFLAALLDRISPEGNKVMAGIMQALQRSGAAPAAIKPFEKYLWETAFALIGTTGALTEQLIVGEAWRNLPVPMAQHPWLLNLLERHWPALIPDSHLPNGPLHKNQRKYRTSLFHPSFLIISHRIHPLSLKAQKPGLRKRQNLSIPLPLLPKRGKAFILKMPDWFYCTLFYLGSSRDWVLLLKTHSYSPNGRLACCIF